MSAERTPLRELTTPELLNLWNELQSRLPPELDDLIGENGRGCSESAEDVRAEIVRRLQAKDQELDAISAKRLEAEAARLLSPVPEGMLSQAEIEGLSNIALKRQLARVKQQYDFEAAAPASETDVWDQLAIESRKSAFKSILASLAREMIRRGLSPDSMTPTESQLKRTSKKCNPEVAKRRAIVARNLGLSDTALCSVFDFDSVPLPSAFEHTGSWKKAYKEPKFRSRIQTLISKDRRLARKS